MYKLINGYTIESLKEVFKKNNTGKPALYKVVNGENDNWDECYDEGEVINEFCVYFNPVDGNRCAVGCYIPDSFIEEHKNVVTDEIDAASLINDYPELAEHMPMEKEGLMAFQKAHDEFNESKHKLNFHDYMCSWIDEYCEEQDG